MFSSRSLWRWFKRLLMIGVTACALSAAAFALVVRHFEADLPDVSNLEATYHPPQVTRVLARDGTLLAELFTERRTVIPINALPSHIKLAFVAAEDAHFYEHEGLNYLGILRAFVVNLRAGRTRQGASTITQQVVKNVLLLDSERSYRRKIREVLLARRLEQKLNKDQILELYLNHIYFGHGRYGIEEASRFYFGRPAHEMSIAQAAMMAGIVASPEGFSPRNHFDKAQDRKRFVLGQMRNKAFMSPAQHDEAMKETLTLSTTAEAHAELAPEVVEIAKKALKTAVGDAATLGGYTITTTIDPKMQAAARKAVRDNLVALDQRHKAQGPFPTPKKGKDPSGQKAFEGTPHFGEYRILVGEVTGADDAAGLLFVRVGNVKGAVRLAEAARYNPKKLSPSEFAAPGVLLRVSLLAPEPEPNVPDAPRVPLRLELGPQSALVALDVRTRQVLAVVGNYEAVNGGLDRATQSRRQPGSTFKPIVYSYALHSRRFTAATLVEARPGTIEGYRPMNFEEVDGDAPLRLREALAKSVNVAAVHVAQQVGPANVVEWAHALGLTGKLGADLSLALGAYEVPPIEMANAYATFASGGMTEAPRFIIKIVDSQGKEVELPEAAPARRVMEANEAFITTSVMTSVIDHGTGARARILRRPLAGKTGTSNKAKDAWFVGFSTDISCAVWTGYDDAQPLGKREAGSTAALPAWIDFMKIAHEGHPPTDFPRPAELVVIRIDPATGLRAYDGQEDAMDEFFLPGTEPSETAQPDAGVDDSGAIDAAKPSGDAILMPSMDQDAGTLPTLPPPESPVPLF